MRDFSWQYFVMTGDVDAYLLYKASHGAQLAAREGATTEGLWQLEAGVDLEGTHGNSHSI